LYVGCIPFGVESTHFDRYFARIANQFAEKSGIADYRLVDYGKAKPQIEALILAAYESGDLRGAVVLDAQSDATPRALAALAPHADVIVRAVG
jgi:hypothetical protein